MTSSKPAYHGHHEHTSRSLSHLQSTKPYDGWSIDEYVSSTGRALVMLKRRNVPLSQTGFKFLALDSKTDCVVGVTKVVRAGVESVVVQGVVLVESDGTVVRKERRVECEATNPNPKQTTNTNPNRKQRQLQQENQRNRQRAQDGLRRRHQQQQQQQQLNQEDGTHVAAAAAEELLNAAGDFFSNLTQSLANTANNANANGTRSAAFPNSNNNNPTNPFTAAAADESISHPDSDSDPQTQLTKAVLTIITILTILRILSNLKFLLQAILFPLAILYAMHTCPPNESFDAKKELKRVLRGHHLPDGHEGKPKNDWISRTVARVTASVAAEAATALGYELSFFVSRCMCVDGIGWMDGWID